MSLSPDDDLIHDRSIDYTTDDNDMIRVTVLGVSDETPEASSAENDTQVAHPVRQRTRVVNLSSPSWEMMDDGYLTAPTSGEIPKGAHSIYDYLSVLEEVSPDLHAIETLLLMDRWTMRDIAASHGVPQSTVMRWRAKGHKLYQEWSDNPAHKNLPYNALARQVFKMWRAGASPTTITTTLNMPQHVVRTMVKNFAADELGLPTASAASLQELSPKQRGGYAPGDRMRERILEAITALTQLKGEAPTGREIQAEIGARSKIDYHLTQMKAQGLIRMANGGHGYEIVRAELITRPKFKRES